MKELTAKVENGLLTINIPVCPEARPVEFNVG
jgi:HSP20 family molecular chaperone IbpA